MRVAASRHSRTVALTLRCASALASQSPSPSVVAATRCSLDAAQHILPHPEKKKTGGEDAAFCGDGVFGVFDGVGGWASRGVDAGEFSRRLATATHDHLTARPELTLAKALAAGVRDIKVLGSCTACLVRINPREGVLEALNVGDSGWRLYRPREHDRTLKLELASTSQQHYFNVGCRALRARCARPDSSALHSHSIARP